jgi:hypothetical protein
MNGDMILALFILLVVIPALGGLLAVVLEWGVGRRK